MSKSTAQLRSLFLQVTIFLGIAGSVLGGDSNGVLAFAEDKGDLGIYAVQLLRQGKLEEGAALLREALQGKQPPLPRKQLSKGDLRHGEEQVTRLHRDRPELVGIGHKPDAIWEWTVESFAGGTAGCRIEWDPEEPFSSHFFRNVSTRGMDHLAGYGYREMMTVPMTPAKGLGWRLSLNSIMSRTTDALSL